MLDRRGRMFSDFAYRTYGMPGPARPALFGLDVCRPDHLAPFVGLGGDKFRIVGRGTRKRVRSQFGKPRRQPWISERGVDFAVELLNDECGRVPGRVDAAPGACLVV